MYKNGLTKQKEKVVYLSFRTRKYGVLTLDNGVCPSRQGKALFLFNRLLKNAHLRRYRHPRKVTSEE